MSDYRQQSEEYKVQRREPAPDKVKVLSKRKKRPKPFLVYIKTVGFGWIKIYAGHTYNEAQAYIEKWNRSRLAGEWEYKIEEKT